VKSGGKRERERERERERIDMKRGIGLHIKFTI
jgi:hypothetical protein